MGIKWNHSEEAKEKIRNAMKNRIVSDETKKKLSLAKKGKKTGIIPKTAFKKGSVSWNKGLSIQTNFSESLFKKGHTSWHKGRKNVFSKETLEKMSVAKIESYKEIENHPRFLKDRSKVISILRHSRELTKFLKDVKSRDNNECKISNNDCSGGIEVHHILRWSEYPELRYDINNGITLCHFHHPRKKEKEIQMVETFRKLIVNKN